eukprot:CAMPEP_0205888868 /NCGR_PEP_ID=MMETSP1083-20121108/20638_1 /ASSEMBLY_ACC=CAM_ASM_000430 /TAXON_ID=97485 /ORGANISM="Prymnesium parvum, Strain Texoma1" /LENGTH=166 /DNA_ID=CAMNT_0053252879 /DNA_START=236 /DNA_END=733 /DNA_ORIENTATION=-
MKEAASARPSLAFSAEMLGWLAPLDQPVGETRSALCERKREQPEDENTGCKDNSGGGGEGIVEPVHGEGHRAEIHQRVLRAGRRAVQLRLVLHHARAIDAVDHGRARGVHVDAVRQQVELRHLRHHSERRVEQLGALVLIVRVGERVDQHDRAHHEAVERGVVAPA